MSSDGRDAADVPPRPADVLPVDDTDPQGFAVVFGERALPTPAAVAEHGARWAPYRMAASWYLWRAAERGA
jgi:3-methyladenine DNA glycosylase/8-oxoguanine DNA glycosylase